jgi:hypothetical protein
VDPAVQSRSTGKPAVVSTPDSTACQSPSAPAMPPGNRQPMPTTAIGSRARCRAPSARVRSSRFSVSALRSAATKRSSVAVIPLVLPFVRSAQAVLLAVSGAAAVSPRLTAFQSTAEASNRSYSAANRWNAG